MKWLLMVIAVLLLLGLIAYVAMAIQSHKRPDTLGLQQGLLPPCPESPNCVCSELHSQSSAQHGIAPIQAEDGVWNQLKNIIIEQGGVIQQEQGSYLHATFTTPVFRYVDDVELRLDDSGNLIHIRSASRTGRSDFGVNRRRVERIRQALEELGKQQ